MLKMIVEPDCLVLWQRGYTGVWMAFLHLLIGGIATLVVFASWWAGNGATGWYVAVGYVVAGLLVSLRAPHTTVTLTRPNGCVLVSHRGWIFRSQTERSLAQVKTATLERALVFLMLFPGHAHIGNWSLQLVFETDEPLELLTNFADKEDAETAFHAVRIFLEQS